MSLRRFKDWSLRWKLLLVLMLCSVSTLLLSALALLAHEVVSARRSQEEQTLALAQVIGANSGAAVAFRDQEAALATLRGLGAQREVVESAIVDVQGTVLARQGHRDAEAPLPSGNEVMPEIRYCNHHLCVESPVVVDGEVIGHVFLRSHLGPQWGRINRYAFILSCVFLIAVGFAFLISQRLQRLISRPVQELARTARRVSDEKDYGLRAVRHGRDEIGDLVEGFNRMLMQMQASDVLLRGQVEFLETLIDTMPMPVFLKDAQGVYQSCNRLFANHVMGLSRQEVLGRSLDELGIQLEDQARQELDRLDARLLAEGGVVTYEAEFTCAHQRRAHYVVSKAVYRGSQGKTAGIVGAMLDVSDRLSAERALRASEARFRSIFSSSGVAIALFDPQLQCLQANPAWRTMMGADGRTPNETWAGGSGDADLSALNANMQRLLRAGSGAQRCELTLTRSDGQPIAVDASMSVIPELDGKVLGIACLLVDISERRHLEQEIVGATTREQRRMAQDLHDGLGQSLTAIAYKAKLLQLGLGEDHGDLGQQAGQVVNLVNRAAAEARHLARGLDPVDVSAEGLPAALEMLAEGTRSVFPIRCSYTGPRQVRLHGERMGGQLYRIAQEAVNNAVRHGKPTTIAIRLEADTEELRLEIQDDGQGISASDTSTGDRPLGGMGRRTMEYRARLLDGTLTFESAAGSGTRILCRVPMAPEYKTDEPTEEPKERS